MERFDQSLGEDLRMHQEAGIVGQAFGEWSIGEEFGRLSVRCYFLDDAVKHRHRYGRKGQIGAALGRDTADHEATVSRVIGERFGSDEALGISIREHG